jgi:hypothetical protein
MTGRNETELERCDRNLVELLQEVRVVQTGVQVLFAFLLMAPLTPRFPRLGAVQHAEYFLTLVLAGAAAVLLIAPTAFHRILFRCGDKEFLVMVSNRLTLSGLAAVGLSMVGALVFVADLLFGTWGAVASGTVAGVACGTLWGVMPLVRRSRVKGGRVRTASTNAWRSLPGRRPGRVTGGAPSYAAGDAGSGSDLTAG